MTFKDIVSGNVSEDVLRASSVTPSQEKVYELERIDGSSQTDPIPAVFIPPVRFFSLPAGDIQRLRDQTAKTETPLSPAGDDLSPTPEIEPISELSVSERAEIAQLGKVVTTAAKELRQRVTLARDRRALRAEQEADETAVRKARESRLAGILEANKAAVDEAEILLDNLVSHFQSLSSRNNRTRGEEVRGRAEGDVFRGGEQCSGRVEGAGVAGAVRDVVAVFGYGLC